MEILYQYDWPGNVRELANVVKRACVLASTPLILPEHLPPHLQTKGGVEETRWEGSLPSWIAMELKRLGGRKDGVLYAHFLGALERPLFQEILRRTGGNQVKAAKLLGINRNTLRKRLKELGL
ncbi:MAG: helix-turn-helix domain-containing protein [Candidatus Methylomirabilales bacterium]